MLYSIFDKLYSAISIFCFSLSIEIGSSLSDEFLKASSGSGLFETNGSKVFFLGTGNDFSGIAAGFGYSFGGSGSFFYGYGIIAGAYFSIGFSNFTSKAGFSGAFMLVDNPFIKLKSKCINIGIEGSACGNPIFSQIWSLFLGS